MPPLTEKLARIRRFLRQVAHLSLPYFRSEERWRARGLLAAIIVLNLAGVYLLVLYNDWNRAFFDALQSKNEASFWRLIGWFMPLGIAFVIVGMYTYYLTQLLEVRWRAWMTRDLKNRWLSRQAFYRMELSRYAGMADQPLTSIGLPRLDQRVPDNPDQRLQEDINLFTAQTVGLSMNLLSTVVTLVSFVSILWNLSSSFVWHGYSIPGFMVWAVVLYCVAGSVITHYVGRPLMGLNFQQQRREADFRHRLVRVREYSEAIALDKGEAVESQQLDGRFGAVLANYLALIRKRKQLMGFTNLFGQMAVVFPYIVSAPRYFSGAIPLGELTQIGDAFGNVQGALSWFVNNYSDLAAWRATTERLTSFESGLPPRTVPTAIETRAHAPVSDITAQNLTLQLPTGQTLLQDTGLHAVPGQHTLIQGPSGSGKSTLLRALAGIWPWAKGTVQLPPGTMVIPQRPYFPDGALRDALAYPEDSHHYSNDDLRCALTDAQLPHLSARLDERDNWAQTLSGGELQRLAIARVLLKRPAWVLADEATSALDPPTEQRMTERLRQLTEDAGGALISIAHRPGLAALHRQTWTFAPETVAADADSANVSPAWRIETGATAS
ncbi:MAG: ABC transporter ATP-binding protein/permease [Burkholderiaceae bacterium]|jgi:putative ATP-binding cassette transporter|nr:ABC transporter ATP-binding protein/permease [Burkholderiaceae bacterium]